VSTKVERSVSTHESWDASKTVAATGEGAEEEEAEEEEVEKEEEDEEAVGKEAHLTNCSTLHLVSLRSKFQNSLSKILSCENILAFLKSMGVFPSSKMRRT